MQFTARKRRQPPAIIIISLIDILIVLLIFLMVTSTFKHRPAIKLTLPESKRAEKGVTDDRLVVTVNKQEPFFYFKTVAVTFEKLQESLRQAVRTNSQRGLTIYADEASTLGNALKVMGAARAAGIRDVTIATREGGG